MAVLPADTLSNSNTLFFGFMRQHGATHDITHRPYIGQVGFAVSIDHDEATLIKFETNLICIQSTGVRDATNRNDQLVDHQFLLCTGSIRVGNSDLLCRRLDLTKLDTHLDVQTLLGKNLVRFFGDLRINSSQKLWHCFKHSDFGTQTSPDAAHLETNHASTDHAELLGDRADVQRAIIGQNLLLIEGQTRQLTRRGARGNHHMLADDISLCRTRNLDRPTTIDLTRERAFAMKEGDLVLFEQIQDAIVVLLYNAVFATNHLVELERNTLDLNTMIGEMVIHLLVVLGGLQQRLGRNTSYVGTCTAWSRTTLAILPGVDTRDGLA